MAAKQKEKTEPQLDADGIVIIEYQQTVLVIVPPDNFGEQGVCQARSQLQSVRVGTLVASSRYDEVLKGRLQEFFLADESLDQIDTSKYAGVIISSGDDNSLAGDERVLRIVREMGAAKKLIASIGNGLEVLINAGVIKGERVTGDVSLKAAAKKVGGTLSGRQVEISGNVVTALNENSGVRFGRGLIEVIASVQAG
jgi:putative intracellular protease/amidase